MITGKGPAQRNGQSGVTLVEMMIVLVVIGVASGAAVLGLGSLTRDDRAARAAQRLTLKLGATVDQVLISGRPATLTWDADGYSVDDGPRDVLADGLVMARQDGKADLLLISDLAADGGVTFLLTGPKASWAVSFDGLVASARLVPQP